MAITMNPLQDSTALRERRDFLVGCRTLSTSTVITPDMAVDVDPALGVLLRAVWAAAGVPTDFDAEIADLDEQLAEIGPTPVRWTPGSASKGADWYRDYYEPLEG